MFGFLVLVQTEGVVTLKMGSLKCPRQDQSGQVLCMDWLPQKPHNVIVVGFYDGMKRFSDWFWIQSPGPEWTWVCVRQKEKVLFLCVQVELDSGIWPLSLHCYKSESRTSLWVCCPIAACWPMTTVSGPWPSVQPPGKVNTVLLLWLAVGLGDNIWFNIQVTVEVSGFFL